MPCIGQSIAGMLRASIHQSKRPCGLSGRYVLPISTGTAQALQEVPRAGKGRSTIWGPDWYLPADAQALQPRSSASQNETHSNSNSAKWKAKNKGKKNPAPSTSTSNKHPCPVVPTQHSCRHVPAASLDVPVTRIAYSR